MQKIDATVRGNHSIMTTAKANSASNLLQHDEHIHVDAGNMNVMRLVCKNYAPEVKRDI